MMMNRPLKFDRSDFRADYEDVAAHARVLASTEGGHSVDTSDAHLGPRTQFSRAVYNMEPNP
jgi:hypothetical protein